MKVVVSDTSSISNLIIIGQLDILRVTYGNIIIPPAVQKEIMALKSQHESLKEFQNASWIEIVPPAENYLNLLRTYNLDLGEREAIALVKSIKADLLIIDEKAGREVAKELGIKTTGLLGTIITAKKTDNTISVKKIMEELVQKAGFGVSKDLYNEVLKLSGEI